VAECACKSAKRKPLDIYTMYGKTLPLVPRLLNPWSILKHNTESASEYYITILPMFSTAKWLGTSVLEEKGKLKKNYLNTKNYLHHAYFYSSTNLVQFHSTILSHLFIYLFIYLCIIYSFMYLFICFYFLFALMQFFYMFFSPGVPTFSAWVPLNRLK
jgi:hypothetical protein